MGLLFYFQQKTAYEMRISDWSSDVCSSDLGYQFYQHAQFRIHRDRRYRLGWTCLEVDHRLSQSRHPFRTRSRQLTGRGVRGLIPGEAASVQRRAAAFRSEEHTSELQSLMRSSYAVFCLKKKRKTRKSSHNHVTR